MSGIQQVTLRVLIVALAGWYLAGHEGEPFGGPAGTRGVQGLNVEGQAELREVIADGRLADLHLADFSDCRKDIDDFYARSAYQPVWIGSADATPQALTILQLFHQADQKALTADDYDAYRWQDRLTRFRAAPNGPEAARFEVALTVSLVRYVRALHFGRLNPKPGGPELDIDGRRYGIADFLHERVVHAPDPQAALAAVEPRAAGYWKALEILQVYRQMAARDDGERLPVPAKPVAPGKGYAGTARLARLLRLLGDLPPGASVPGDPEAYEGALVDAVKSFQLRHGQTSDGVLDAELIKELNVPLSHRVRQLELMLERWRWLPHSSSGRSIIVNLPEFRLHALEGDNRETFASRIIVGGSHGHRSPVFEKTMKYVIFRPRWDVPRSIQRREIVPHIQKDRDYLAKHHYQVVAPDGAVVTDGSIDEQTLAGLSHGRLRVRQKSGPANALGLVKFVFPNEYDVYMHDTDAPKLFSRERRDLSHGCIRVEGAAELAVWVLRNNPGWDLQRVREAMNGRQNNLTVHLAQPVSVVIFYGTVALDAQGTISFFNDVYGYDAQLDQGLTRAHGAAEAFAKLSDRTGP